MRAPLVSRLWIARVCIFDTGNHPRDSRVFDQAALRRCTSRWGNGISMPAARKRSITAW